MKEHCNDAEILRGLCQEQGREHLKSVSCLEKKCKRDIVKWLTRHGIPSDESEAMWYESVTDAWKNLCLDGKPLFTSFCGYLFSIAQNKWKKYWRERGKQAYSPTPSALGTPFEDAGWGIIAWLSPRKKKSLDDKLRHMPVPEEPENPIPEDILRVCRSLLNEQGRNILDDALAGFTNEELAEKYSYSVNVLKATKSRHVVALARCVHKKIAERHCFGKLDPKCQALIRDRRSKLTWEAIAKKNGFDEPQTVQAAHNECNKKLDDWVALELSKFKK